MPFTPFHLGPGVAFKAIAPTFFSFTVFSFVQVLMDTEPLYYMIKGEWPLHRFFHTYIGATAVAIPGVVISRPICQWFLRNWNYLMGTNKGQPLYFEPVIRYKAVLFGSFAGAYSHVLLDSIMHSDIKPFSPFISGNNMLGALSLGELHLFCLIIGVIGVLVLSVYGLLRFKKA